MDVIDVAKSVPIGIDFCGSARSAERFEPAMIPKIHFMLKIQYDISNYNVYKITYHKSNHP